MRWNGDTNATSNGQAVGAARRLEQLPGRMSAAAAMGFPERAPKPTRIAQSRYLDAFDAPALPRRDSDIGLIFRQMRAVTGLSEVGVARALAISVDTVIAFEVGAIDLFPALPQTARIVADYSRLAGVDATPLLSRILALQTPSPQPMQTAVITKPRAATAMAPPRARLPLLAGLMNTFSGSAPDKPSAFAVGTAIHHERRKPATTGTSTADPSTASVDRRRNRRRLRRTLALIAPAIALAAFAAAVHLAPQPAYRLAGILPSVLQQPLRAMLDTMVMQSAPIRDGLRWIELRDPRVRKGDLLTTPR